MTKFGTKEMENCLVGIGLLGVNYYEGKGK